MPVKELGVGVKGAELERGVSGARDSQKCTKGRRQ